jgi:transposase
MGLLNPERIPRPAPDGWFGDKAHITDTCDAARPHLRTHIETTPATTQAAQVTELMHHALAQQNLRPAEQRLDRGDVDPQVLIDSATNHGLAVLGPLKVDTTWPAQAREGL